MVAVAPQFRRAGPAPAQPSYPQRWQPRQQHPAPQPQEAQLKQLPQQQQSQRTWQGRQVAAPQRTGHFIPRRLCSRWMETGWCWKAEACTFAHGLHEVHPDAQAQAAGCLAAGPGATAGAAPAPALSADAPVFAPAGASAAEGAVEAGSEQPDFAFNADAAPFVFDEAAGADGSGFQLNADAKPFEMAQAAAGFTFNANAASFEPPTASLVWTEGVDGEADNSFAFNADAEPFKPTPAGTAEQDSPATESGKTPRQSSKLEEAPQTPVAKPNLILPGVAARVVPTRTTTPRSPIASPTLVVAALPEPLPSPAAAAALKFIKRNSALVPPSPNSQNMLLQSPSAVPLLPMQLFKAAEDSTRENTTGSYVTELSSPARSIFSLRDPRSPSLCAGQSPQWTPQSPLAAPPPLALPPPQQALPPPQSPELRAVGQPIPRGVLLQAGLTLRAGIQLGPPGLAHCAPTPTSKARLAGFALPQPGLISAQPIAPLQVAGVPRRGSA